MNKLRKPLLSILHAGLLQFRRLPIVLERLDKATGEVSGICPLDGVLLLAEAWIEYRTRGIAKLPLLVLAVIALAIVLLAVMPVLWFGEWAAGFLESHSDTVSRERETPGSLISPAALMLMALLLATISTALP